MKYLQLVIFFTISFLVSSCGAQLPVIKMPSANPHLKTFNDVTVAIDHCSLKNRIARCKLTFTSLYRDRVVNFAGYVKLQDDAGIEYPTKVGFGENSSTRKRSQIMVADQPYSAHIEAENLSTRAQSIRAVIIDRIGIGFGPRQHIATHKNIIFSKPPMLDITRAISTPQSNSTVKTTNDNIQKSTTSSSYEVGINLPFGDMAMFVLDKPDAMLCLAKCEENNQCKSWTYVKPGIQGLKANCWLKNTVPNAVPDANTTSGIMKR